MTKSTISSSLMTGTILVASCYAAQASAAEHQPTRPSVVHFSENYENNTGGKSGSNKDFVHDKEFHYHLKDLDHPRDHGEHEHHHASPE